MSRIFETEAHPMIVCICFNVSDRLVRDRAREGASLGAILEETGAGASCGTCRLRIARLHAGEQVEPAACARRMVDGRVAA